MKVFNSILILLLPFMMNAREIKLLHYADLSKEIQNSGDTILILNFWATWCKPCIEELPYFEELNQTYRDQKVKLVLVNLDFNSKVESETIPFVQKKKLLSTVYHLMDSDPNEWINQVDSNWSGAIPATVIYQSGQKVFFVEGPVNDQHFTRELEKILEERAKKHMNKN